jgi:hypothetical protein
MDDAEDVEQVYLSVNRDEFVKEPRQPRYSLREIIDEMKLCCKKAILRQYCSNDEKQAPLDNINLLLFHHYWFSPTESGKQIWQTRSGSDAS